jgi:hypothetical protein
MENVKWGRIVMWGIVGILILVVAPILYVTIRMVILGFQMGGNPPQEAQREFASGIQILVVLLVAGGLAGFLGGRGPARKAEGSYLLNGILAGVLVSVLFIVYSLIGGGFDLMLLVVIAVIIALAALGGWAGGRAAEAAAYD